jgi:hypothetical protein
LEVFALRSFLLAFLLCPSSALYAIFSLPFALRSFLIAPEQLKTHRSLLTPKLFALYPPPFALCFFLPISYYALLPSPNAFSIILQIFIFSISLQNIHP